MAVADQPGELVVAWQVDVVVDGAGRDCLQRHAVVAEGRHVDGHTRRVTEGLQRLRVDVVGPVEDLEGSVAFRLQATRDGPVVPADGP